MTRIAVIQMETALLEMSSNQEKIIRAIHQAAAEGARIAVFPECALSGYNVSVEEAARVAMRIPGEGLRLLIEACREADILAAVGLLEEQDGQLFNTAALIGPGGLISKYRKTHLPLLGIDRYLSPGGEITPPCKTSLARVGMLVCYDIRFPEPIRVLALAGAQIVLLPTAWPDKAALYPDFLIRARAEENRVYIAAANHVGEERGVLYLGRSIIAAPDGEILAQGGRGEEEILYADIDPGWSDRKRIVFSEGEYELDLFQDRRPELYGTIVRADSAY